MTCLNHSSSVSEPATKCDRKFANDCLKARADMTPQRDNVRPISGRAGTVPALDSQEAYPPARSTALAGYASLNAADLVTTNSSKRCQIDLLPHTRSDSGSNGSAGSS